MEIRTLRPDEGEAWLELLDGWDLADGWRGRDFFRRFLTHDPTMRFDNVWVASDERGLHGCMQIFPRRIRVLGHAVPTGGIGSVYTRPAARESGIASALLDRAVEAMHDAGMELSLLFAARTGFYGSRGWAPWTSERTILRSSKPPSGQPEDAADAGIELARFDRSRDLEAVQTIHAAYSASRSGTVVRDADLWEASLRLGGNPHEDFWVARQGGSVVAYARATLLYEVYTVTELARLEPAADALACLMQSLLTPRDPDWLVPAGKTSAELRAFLLLPCFDDIPFTVSLEQRDMTAHPIADPTTMLRCLDAEALARRLDVALLPGEDGPRFLSRILPQDHFVFWPADRF